MKGERMKPADMGEILGCLEIFKLDRCVGDEEDREMDELAKRFENTINHLTKENEELKRIDERPLRKLVRSEKENQELKKQLKEVRFIAEHAEKHHKGDRCECISRILKAAGRLDK